MQYDKDTNIEGVIGLNAGVTTEFRHTNITVESLDERLDVVFNLLERLEQKIDELTEQGLRLEECLINISSPGGNFSIDYVDQE